MEPSKLQPQSPRPDALQVARRLLVIRFEAVLALTAPANAVMQGLARSWNEGQRGEFDEEWKRNTATMVETFDGTGWKGEMTDDEWAFIQSTPLQWEPQRVIDASWRVESAAALLWALELIPELTPFDAAAGQAILKHVPTQDPSGFVMNAKLMAPERIDRKREEADLWHWRSRTRQLAELGVRPQVPNMETFEDVIAFVTKDLKEKGILKETIDDDFPTRGQSYANLPAAEWAEVRSITTERLRGLNWLCGYAPENRWDETPTDA